MAGKPVGVMTISLDLETAAYTKSQKKILNESKEAALTINANFQRLGVTSDQIYNAMATRAELAFRKIGLSSKASLAEVERSYAAMVATINATNQKMVANPLYETLGIRSVAAIEAQKAAVISSYDAIKTTGNHTAQDLINIEHAKNAKLKELNKEMVGQHEMSMASMTRALLRFYAAYYVVSSAISNIASLLMGGVKAIDDMQFSAISIASTITSMQGTTGNIAENYKKNLEYAKGLVPVLMQIDANSYANLQDIIKMNMQLALHGVLLDANKSKQVESFTALSNAVKIFTNGQDQAKQVTQEIRAMFTGMIRPGDLVAMQLDSLIKQEGKYAGGLKEVVKLGLQHGDTLERFLPYLTGIVAGVSDIQKTWAAVSSSMETSWNIIQRGLFADFYKSLVKSGGEANTWLKKNADDIVESIKGIVDTFKWAIFSSIATMGLFSAAAWIHAYKAGDAVKWFMKMWAWMETEITLSTSRMLLAWYGFIGGILGFAFGTWISDNWELARTTAVKAVYGMIGAWDLFKLKVATTSEKVKAIFEMMAQPKKADEIGNATRARIQALEDEYEIERQKKGQWGREQLIAVTDQAIAENKARIEEAKKLLPSPPKVPPPKPPGEKDSVRDLLEQLSAQRQAHKAYYDEVVKDAEQAAKLSQRAGQDEYLTIATLYKAKRDALLAYTQVQISDAQKLVDAEKKGAAISKDGIGKKYDAEAVFNEKKLAILAQYDKKYKELTGEQKIAIEDANNATLAKMADLYKTIDQYSNDSLTSEIAAIEVKKKADARYSTATIEQRKVLDTAYAAWELALRINSALARYQIELSYLEMIKGPYSEMYKVVFEEQIKKEADLMAIKMQSLNVVFDREEFLAQKRRERNMKELADKVNFYNKIDGFDKASYELELKLIKMRQVENTKLYGKQAADAQAAAEIQNASFKRYAEPAKSALGEMSTALEDIGNLYAQGSEEQKKYHQLAMQFALAQKGIDTANAVVKGVEAVINAMSNGDGYTAIFRGAAVAAVVASYLSQIGASFSGAGGGGVSVGAAYGSNTTVLGGANDQGSESISKSWELMQDTYDMEYRELSGIYSEMKDLNDNITGLVTGIIRTGSIGNFGIAEGTTIGSIQSAWDSIVSATYLGTQDLFNTITLGISGWIDNAISGIVGSIFGGGTSTSIVGTGIKTGNASISDLLSGGGIGAVAYTKVRVDEDGGWFGSDSTSYYTKYKALDTNVSNLLDKVFRNMGTTMIELSREFGTDVNAALNYVFKGASINLKGMDSEEINKTLTEYFSGIGDTAVEALFGSIVSQYQKVGEGLMETASRLLIDKGVISYWIDKMNQSFHGTIPEAIKFSETLITIAGSLEDLTDAMQTYYDKFFSDSEKQAKLQQELTAGLSMYGYGLPSDRSAYRALVESLNLTTDAGQAAYVALMQMSESADQYYSYLEDAKDAVKSNIKPENYSTNLEYQRALAMIPAYADGGYFAGGYRIVGENGPEIEYTAPSMIYSNKDSKSLLNNDELVAEIRVLIAELGAGNFQNAANIQKLAKYLQYLEQWDDDGIPPTRS